MWNFLTQIKDRPNDNIRAEDRRPGGRRSSMMEFGMDEAQEPIPENFEVCKGIVLTLD